MDQHIDKQLAFSLEIDKVKNIFRQTHLSGSGRNENDAEHSWHMAIMAYLFREYSLARINAFHSNLSAYWPDAKENLPATKYLDINLTFFWWLEKNKDLTAQQKVDELYAYLTGKTTMELSYEQLRTKHIGLDTKGLIPDHV